MASLWMRSERGELIERPLHGEAVLLSSLSEVEPDRECGRLLSVVRTAECPPAWALLAESGLSVRVNGEPVFTGIRLLDSRDEIRCGSLTAVFSDEHHARVEAFPEERQDVCCARCACEVEPGTPAVRCPVCGSWYHQQEPGDFPCWTAVPFCQVCGCATSTEREAWRPEEF